MSGARVMALVCINQSTTSSPYDSTPRGIIVELASVHTLIYPRYISGCLVQPGLSTSDRFRKKQLKFTPQKAVDAGKVTPPLLRMSLNRADVNRRRSIWTFSISERNTARVCRCSERGIARDSKQCIERHTG